MPMMACVVQITALAVNISVKQQHLHNSAICSMILQTCCLVFCLFPGMALFLMCSSHDGDSEGGNDDEDESEIGVSNFGKDN